jgi:hypothetical protein
MEKPVLKRQVSEMETFQGIEHTCYAHVVARLMVRNVHEMPNETNQWTNTCNKALNTQHIDLDVSKKKCGENGYLKICVFLYYYYNALQYGQEVTVRGKRTMHVMDALIRHSYNHSRVPSELMAPQYDDILATAKDYFKTVSLPKNISVMEVILTPGDVLTDPKQTPLANMILLFLHMNYYIGFSYQVEYPNGKVYAHIVTLMGYDAESECFIGKDSAKKGNMSILIRDIGTDSLHVQGRTVPITFSSFYFIGKFSRTFFPDKDKVLRIAKQFQMDYTYREVNPFSEKKISKLPDMIPEKEHEPTPEIICKKNKACPSPCGKVTRNKPRTTAYCRKRRLYKETKTRKSPPREKAKIDPLSF